MQSESVRRVHMSSHVVQILTGEDWNALMYNGMRAIGDYACLYFVTCFFIGNYLVLNLFIAVLLNNKEVLHAHSCVLEHNKAHRMVRSPFVCAWHCAFAQSHVQCAMCVCAQTPHCVISSTGPF